MWTWSQQTGKSVKNSLRSNLKVYNFKKFHDGSMPSFPSRWELHARWMYPCYAHVTCSSWYAIEVSLTKLSSQQWSMQQVVSEPDPQKIEKEGRVNWLEWKYTLCLCTSDWLLISILMCVYWKCLHNRTRQSSHFVSLESCKHQARKREQFVRVSDSAQNPTGFARFGN